MNEDAYLDAYWEDAYQLEPLDGFGDEADFYGDEGQYDDDPNPYDGDYSED